MASLIIVATFNPNTRKNYTYYFSIHISFYISYKLFGDIIWIHHCSINLMSHKCLRWFLTLTCLQPPKIHYLMHMWINVLNYGFFIKYYNVLEEVWYIVATLGGICFGISHILIEGSSLLSTFRMIPKLFYFPLAKFG